MLLVSITLTRLTSTGTANYPGSKLLGVALKLRNLNEISPCVHVLNKTLNLVISIWCFAEDGKEMFQKSKTREQNCCFCSLNLLFCGVQTLLLLLSLLSSVIAMEPDLNGTDTKNRILPWNTINSSRWDSNIIFYCINITFFIFLLSKSCKSGIKLTYVCARGVREFRVS